uniref:Properdin n=1 Tax=Chrysemys picta bellii TaxID=8478 RepID=A0A8C3FDE3_CHRPI
MAWLLLEASGQGGTPPVPLTVWDCPVGSCPQPCEHRWWPVAGRWASPVARPAREPEGRGWGIRRGAGPVGLRAGQGCPALCSPRPCPFSGPVNGAWAPWGEWSDCDAECRGGVRSRTRSCADPPPKNGGQPCPGDAVEACHPGTCEDGHLQCRADPACRLDGGWGAWGPPWTPCSVSCGGLGHMTRARGCTSPPPANGGKDCVGRSVRTRTCTSPPPKNGGARCPGEKYQGLLTRPVSPVHGSWTPWSPWSDCPVTCGNGTHVRTRACINPPPRNNGSACAGPEAEAQGCAARPCPGEWPAERCDWSAWSPCSRSCGIGLATRTGTCACPSPEGPSAPCNDSARQEVEPCYLRPCEGRGSPGGREGGAGASVRSACSGAPIWPARGGVPCMNRSS